MNRTTSRLLAACAAAALVVAACGDDDDDGVPPTRTLRQPRQAARRPPRRPRTRPAADTTGDTGGETTEATDDDRGHRRPRTPARTAAAAARAGPSRPRTASIPIGSTNRSRARSTSARRDRCRAGRPRRPSLRSSRASRPTSTTPTRTGCCPTTRSRVSFGDDQYDPALTPGVINGALDDGAHLISGMIGTPNNLAVRDTLNEECVPHLEAASGDPAFGEVADYPWTMGSNLPYDTEWQIYAEDVAQEFPDGATAALFYVNNDAGLVVQGRRSRRRPASSASRSWTTRRSRPPRAPHRPRS